MLRRSSTAARQLDLSSLFLAATSDIMASTRSALARLTRARAHTATFPARPVSPAARPRCLVGATRAYAATTADRLPRIVQPSLWQNLLPKHFRSSHKRPFTWREWRAKDWNPASIYIMFGLVVGSNAINTLILRRDIADFTRKADAKIALLREVLEKVQNGEEVDVERILGTGRQESEREWEEGMCTNLSPVQNRISADGLILGTLALCFPSCHAGFEDTRRLKARLTY